MRLGERGFPKPSATGICTRIMNWCKACNAVDTQGKTLAYKCLERAQGRIASCPNKSTIEMRSGSYDMHDSASGARRPRCRIHVYLKHVKKQSKGKKQKSKATEQKVQKTERERERKKKKRQKQKAKAGQQKAEIHRRMLHTYNCEFRQSLYEQANLEVRKQL